MCLRTMFLRKPEDTWPKVNRSLQLWSGSCLSYTRYFHKKTIWTIWLTNLLGASRHGKILYDNIFIICWCEDYAHDIYLISRELLFYGLWGGWMYYVLFRDNKSAYKCQIYSSQDWYRKQPIKYYYQITGMFCECEINIGWVLLRPSFYVWHN
jgi:hypothetical protein